MRNFLFLSIFFIAIQYGGSFKYLVYNPIYSHSHVSFADKVANALRNAGHTVIQFNPVETSSIDLKKYDHKDNWIRHPKNLSIGESISTRLAKSMWDEDGLSLKELLKQFHDAGSHFAKHCRDQLRDDEWMDRLRNEKFDFALTEFYDICGLAIFEKIGITRFAAFAPFPMMHFMTENFGVPAMSSFIPDLSTVSTPDMSFLMRFRNFYSSLVVGSVTAWSLFGYPEQVIREEINPNFDVMKKCAEASYYFISADLIIDFPKPISPKFIYIGGLGISQIKPSDKNKEIENITKNGFIFVSFGTVALSRHMPDRIKQIFVDTFKEFSNTTFIWKYEAPEDGSIEKLPNLHLQKWVDQPGLLTHPNLLGFITHGGLNSIMEATYCGAPVITIGLFGDQERNGKMAEYRGYGLTLDKLKLSKASLGEKLSEIIGNDKYRQNAKELSLMLRSKPYSAEDLLVKHTVYATQFDVHSRLDIFGRHLSFFRYHNLDIICLLIIKILIIFFVLFKLTKFVFSLILRCLFGKQKIE